MTTAVTKDRAWIKSPPFTWVLPPIRVKVLKESAALFRFLQSNGINSIDELHEKITAMREDIKAVEQIRKNAEQLAKSDTPKSKTDKER